MTTSPDSPAGDASQEDSLLSVTALQDATQDAETQPPSAEAGEPAEAGGEQADSTAAPAGLADESVFSAEMWQAVQDRLMLLVQLDGLEAERREC